MRIAELCMALVMAVFSVYLMSKSAELPIGWIEGEGPGGGAFPFWIAFGMLICCAVIVYNWFKRASVPSKSEEAFMDREAVHLFLVVSSALIGMIGLIHIVGVYFSLPLFMVFYMRYLGQHSWKLVSLIAVMTPVITFLFFEVALTKTLPKGFSEPLFYPLYDLIY
jgi:hypothetical protein